MITDIEYALMAGASYISTRADINRFPTPDGWVEKVIKRQAWGSGYEATYFVSQCSNDIVISFAGTDPGDWMGDMGTNIALAAGNLNAQLIQAAEYYLQVKAANPGATITFTGHSLGGGLASLMGVFFNLPAHTFDQAPFVSAALTFNTTDINGDPVLKFAARDLRDYLYANSPLINAATLTALLAPLDAYVTATDPATLNPNAADTLAVRGAQVSNINVQDEFISSWFLIPSSNRIGTQADLHQQNNMNIPLDTGLTLHAQVLLTAMLQSGDTKDSTAADHTLGQASFKLTDLLKMIFDGKLYSYPTATSNDKNVNFLEHLVQYEACVRDPANDESVNAWRVAA